MAKNTYKSNHFKQEPKPKRKLKFKFNFSFFNDPKFKFSTGLFLIILSVFLSVSFVSFLFTGKADQSVLQAIFDQSIQSSGQEIENWLGLLGAFASFIFIYKWFGISAFLINPLIFLIGFKLLVQKEVFPIYKAFKFISFMTIWISMLFGYMNLENSTPNEMSFMGGGIGFELATLFNGLVGWGTLLFLLFALVIFVVYFFNLNTTAFKLPDTPQASPKEPKAKQTQNETNNSDEVKVEQSKEKLPDEVNVLTRKVFSHEGRENAAMNKEGDDMFDLSIEHQSEEEMLDNITLKSTIKNSSSESPSNEDNLDKQLVDDFAKESIIAHELDAPATTPINDDFSQNPLPTKDPDINSNIQLNVNVSTSEKPQENLPEKKTEIILDLPDASTSSKKAKKSEAPSELTLAVEDTTINEEKNETLTSVETERKKLVEEKLGTDIDEFDPTLELGNYQYPDVDLLIERPQSKKTVSQEELEENKDKIVETLVNFKIGISSIKATIGPTITLYEIVPEAGVKISKIKNLEDDIALSLSALGIRIIAPIPGKGTIGIEVPNTHKEAVSMKSVIATDKFLNESKMALPIAIGKTISNDVFITDLAKMPHLLMAGATGQGKSVGLNAILSSLLYKKHPSELKLVMVDPKKVELTLYNKIEKHYLAKLPDSEEAIITDTTKVINTLNSLCVEMDQRYDLLKEAHCRNIIEYNSKFKSRMLNPEKGHKFLPYIVLVIDELADLMMTAGKEVETPIARLAQLARAIGIHLVVATQRPSVNVITGIIKANFPARLSFRVTSKIDSRTILDCGGAEQLIGKGDMLLSMGSDLTRLQCAFIDTPEVEDLCNFIAAQKSYPSAYSLPEYTSDDSDGGNRDLDLSDRDVLFEEAARTIVSHQQGSTSLLQRKLKLGYNRAGRIIDQLEAAGIVGPYEGSKAREVLIPDEYALEQLLSSLE
ncbi:DNA translocase FtsK [Aureibacter tunicatorum]|uniref:S-DNA-T family DNA segregation ATPase FtsK/SpoIIIE n=1 Tax=Aureibacter tunicatorum TaxID=866807 RepID=A0AAE4BSF5_9BACT|nr:DNA translocase FtsK [Aureibacter tunicatorum]MDR6238347.1 S-DNA-T family DNA segregation ATPase FtsK/SpoIIIE [Aureibacter tunicatorum]BDD03379.1 hypothetical protein AUTU_08620 [Aureibacter tunicatorum]